jgi:predicted ribosomally synthesized peptide with SipW-like signal peptide
MRCSEEAISLGGGDNNLKKILKSLVVLGAVGALAIGITSAYFSDSETSTGNTFQAGKIDLKIDHVLASYNGRDCDEECEEQENLVQNISFEEPVVTDPTNWDIYDSPVGGWIVEWRGDIPASFEGQPRPDPAHLEYHRGVLGNAYEGEQYVELDSDWNGHTGSLNNEPASVTIHQDITTTAGANYKLRFAFAPRPDTPAADNHLEVKWDGAVVWDSGTVAGAAGPINWQYIELNVSATGNSTELRFTDLGTANSLGTFLDDITLNEVVCKEGIGELQCHLWEEKDLEEGDFFWNFEDIKPGDYGRNVISMHVYDNDYWACLLSDKDDQENGITDPESEAGDITDPQGELSNYIDIFIWTDNNQNGVYEPGLAETPIYEDGFPAAIDLNEPPNPPWLASTTYYLGMAWCLGEQTVDHNTGNITCDGSGNYDDAQTDSFDATLKFYAEQSRNNDEFSCEGLITPTPSPE